MKIEPRSGDARLHVLAYHEIGQENLKDIYTLTSDDFIQHLWVISRAERENGPTFSVTFDDGHRSNIEFAAPLLEMQNIQGHFFLPAAWISSRAGFLSWDDARTLAKRKHRIGSHSDTHAFLTQCSGSRLKDELYGSRMKLEDGIGVEVTTISMPGGRWNEEVLRACSTAGYKTVYTSEPGYYRAPNVIDGQQTPQVIGRFAVRRQTGMRTLDAYCSGGQLTTKYLNAAYHARRAIRGAIGDKAYQTIWTRMFRAANA